MAQLRVLVNEHRALLRKIQRDETEEGEVLYNMFCYILILTLTIFLSLLFHFLFIFLHKMIRNQNLIKSA